MADYNINVVKRTVALSDICVPKAYKYTTPAKAKMDKVNAFYTLTGGFGKEIIVNQNMTLLDGYTAYLCAKANRLDRVKVLQATAKAIESKQDKPEPVKLYCVKNLNEGIKRGDIGCFDPERKGVIFGNLELGVIPGSKSFEEWKEKNWLRATHFVPLVSRPAKVGEWVYMLRDDCMKINKKGDIVEVVGNDFIKDPTGRFSVGISATPSGGWCLVLDGHKPEPEKEPFVPHLESSAGKHYGVIGKKTDYVDAVGRPLCVGDVVELFKDGHSRGEHCIVERKLPGRGDKEKVFVMSIESDCENGSIVNGWKVVKVKDHSDLKNGESYDAIKACLSDE